MKEQTPMKETNEAKKSVGRPKADVKFPNKAFTLDMLHEQYPTLHMLTIRNHVKAAIKNNVITKIKSVNDKTRGAPPHRFLKTAIYNSLMARKKSKPETSVPTSVEQTTTEVATTPETVQTEVPATPQDTQTVETAQLENVQTVEVAEVTSPSV